MAFEKINLAHMDRCPVPEAKPWLRLLLIVFGWLCMVIGAIGAVRPGLPATIFLIMVAVMLLAACYILTRDSRSTATP